MHDMDTKPADTPDLEEEAQLLERTDNGPRSDDGEQPSQDPDLFPLAVR